MPDTRTLPIIDLIYLDGSAHGPEVDFGVGWVGQRSNSESGRYRVTWVAAWDDNGWTDRGDVVAVGRDATGNDETLTLASDLPLFVVEALLSRTFYTVGLGPRDDIGWCSAVIEQAGIKWVTDRLAKYCGCTVVRYHGKLPNGGIEKAARTFAKLNGYEGRGGGWIYGPDGRPFTQGWFVFAKHMERAGMMRLIAREVGQADYADIWIVIDKTKRGTP